MAPFNPSPLCPIPFQFDVEGKIKELETMLQDPDTKEDQKPNLQLAIDLYRNELSVLSYSPGNPCTLRRY